MQANTNISETLSRKSNVEYDLTEAAKKRDESPQVTPYAAPQALSEVELKILRFCEIARSRSEIIDFTKMNQDYIRKEVIPKLIEKGFLDLTIPDKPRSPYQKYVLTGAVKKSLGELQ